MTRCRLLPLLACTALAGAAPLAGAESSPYYLGASQTFTRDSNLLRLSDGQQAPAGFTKADTVSSTSLLAGLDQTIGRQRLFGDLSIRSNRLSNNDVYNNLSYGFSGGIDWSTVDNISGSLKASTNRNLASLNTTEIGLLTKKNLETTQQVDAAIRIGVVTKLTAEATLGHRSVAYSAAEYQSREFRQNSASLGMRYRPSGSNTFGIAVRQADGKYPKFRPLIDGSFQPDTYTRRDLDLTATLQPSAISSLNARLSLGKTSYEVATERDFSGVTGLLGWRWQPTGKLRFYTQVARDPGQDSYFLDSAISNATIDYSRLTTSISMRADYEATAKIGLNATLSAARSSLTRTLPPAPGFDSQVTGSDRSTKLALGGTWAPLRSVQVGCDVSRLRRSGKAPLSSDLSDTVFSCFGQLTLQ